MAFDVQKYLTELGMSEEDRAAVVAKLTPYSDKLEKSFLMQSDYSREMDKLQKMKTDLEAKNEQLNSDLAEFATLSASEQNEATELRNRIEKAENDAFKLTQKITRYASENNIDVKTVLGDVEPAKEPAKAAAFDETKLRGEINGTIGGFANYMLDLAASVDDIAEEHKALTGEKFDRKKFIAGIKADIAAKKTDNLDPVRRWEAQFGIPEKRTAAALKTREEERAKDREEGRQAALSEMALPGGHVPQGGEHNSPVFKTTNVSKGSVLQRPQPSARLNGAVSALATGKYRTTKAA